MNDVRQVLQPEWAELVERFQKLREITGTNKSSSYQFRITFDLWSGLFMSMGTYDVADWPRHTDFTSPNAQQGLADLRAVVERAEAAVKEEQWDALWSS